MLNKKSQIAFGMLPFIALILCSIAFYSFFTFGKNTSSASTSILQLSENSEFSYQYVTTQAKLLSKKTFSECQTCTAEQFKEKFKQNSLAAENLFKYENAGNFYGKLRAGEFQLEKQENAFTLKISDLFVQTESEYNKITKNFDICFAIKENSIQNCEQ